MIVTDLDLVVEGADRKLVRIGEVRDGGWHKRPGLIVDDSGEKIVPDLRGTIGMEIECGKGVDYGGWRKEERDEFTCNTGDVQ